MTNDTGNIFSLESRLKKNQDIKQSKNIILKTNSLTDAIFDITSAFYGDNRINVNSIYTQALQTYQALLSGNYFSVLSSKIDINDNLQKMLIESNNTKLDTRDINLTGNNFDNLLGCEYQFQLISENDEYSNKYNIKQIPSRQQIFDNACNNFSNCVLKYIIDQACEIKFPTKKEFSQNPNISPLIPILLNNPDKLIIRPSIYNHQTGEIFTEPDLNITQDELKNMI
jgi:hypothetical protein